MNIRVDSFKPMHTEPDEVIEKLTRPQVKKTNSNEFGDIFEIGTRSAME